MIHTGIVLLAKIHLIILYFWHNRSAGGYADPLRWLVMSSLPCAAVVVL
jgi:hypothetical protein